MNDARGRQSEVAEGAPHACAVEPIPATHHEPVMPSTRYCVVEVRKSPVITPVCRCPALGSPGPSLHAHGPRGSMTTSYCVHIGAAPYTTRKAQTILRISGFYHAALTLAPYASCGPCGRATQCSHPSGCQPFSGRIVYPPGIIVVFHFVFLFLYSVPHNQVFWRDMHFVVPLQSNSKPHSEARAIRRSSWSRPSSEHRKQCRYEEVLHRPAGLRPSPVAPGTDAPRLRSGLHIFHVINLLFCASKTCVARRAYSEHRERCKNHPVNSPNLRKSARSADQTLLCGFRDLCGSGFFFPPCSRCPLLRAIA